MSRPILNRPLVLESPGRSTDGSGGYARDWVPLGTLWARIEPRATRIVTGVESGTLSVGRFAITVRGAPIGSSNRPQAGQRFRMGDRIFRISAVTEAEPDIAYLTCDCIEELAV